MKYQLNLLAGLLILAATPTFASQEICSSREIMKLMIQKGVWKDPRQSKVCLDMSAMPNVRMYLEDGTYDVHGKRQLDYKKEQDASVKKVYDLFEKAIPLDQRENAPFAIKTKGFADGVFGSSSFDGDIGRELIVNGKLDYASIEELVKKRNKDEKGFDSLVSLVKKMKGYESFGKSSPGPSLEALQNNRPLISQLRNVYEAKSRGDELCNGIFGAGASSGKCDIEAYISPDLDRGKNCIDGCCDGRRGAVVDITLPVLEESGNNGNGEYYPSFNLASKNTQLAMQAETSLHVVNLPIAPNKELDKKIMAGDFLSPDLIEKDRERFRSAMKDIGCDSSDVTVDSFRRIYWSYHLVKGQLSFDVKNAIEKGDLKTVLKLASKTNTSNIDKSTLTAIQSGGRTIKLNSTSLVCDATKEVKPWEKKKDIPKVLEGCSLISGSDSKWFAEQGINNLYDLSLKAIESETLHIVAASANTYAGNFWYFDEVAQKSRTFSIDRKCAANFAPGTFASVPPKGDWPKRTADPEKNKFNEACFKRDFGTLPEPNKFNVNNFLRKFTPAGTQNGGEGSPTDYLNCLPVNKAYDLVLANGGPEAEKTQKPFCKVQGGNKLSIGMDPANMNNVQTNDGHNIKGHVCKMCESGTMYDPKTKKLVHQPRTRKWKRTDLGDVYGRWEQTSNPKLNNEITLGGSKRLLTYLIPNCGTSCDNACACLKGGDIGTLMRDAEKFDFFDKELPNEQQVQRYKGDGSGSFACLYSPPVSATCMVAPQGSSSEGDDQDEKLSYECLVVEKLKAMPDMSPVLSTPTDSEIDAIEASCSTSKNFPADESTCEGQSNPLCFNKRKEVAAQCGEPSKKSTGKGNATEQ